MSQNENKLKSILANTFALNINEISDDASPDTLPAWDSLNHLKLILAIESEFNISFTEEQSVEILSLPLIKEVLKEHHINF